MRAVWRRLIRLGFRLLYNELAWLYDPVSWLASLGLWRQWLQTTLQFLPPGSRVLEIGFGPGHLLLDLARAGYRVAGLDLSPAMLRRAQRRLRRSGHAILLCRGRAGALPFAPAVFDAVVITFPTPYVYEPALAAHLARILRGPGGRLVVVELATFRRKGLPGRSLEWLYHVTGQRGPSPDLPALLASAGLRAWRETVPVAGTGVGLVLAEKVAPAGPRD